MREMKNSEDNGSAQDDLILLDEKKKDPISRFFQGLKVDIQDFSDESEEYFISIKKDVEKDWGIFKTSWKNMIKNIKKMDPRYNRFKKLYNKLREMESTVSEIKDDTKEIKLDISQVTFMIENLMGDIKDVEGYMKENLGSDWKILKNSWQKCKSGEISKGQFIKIGLSKIGKKFAGIFF